MCQLDTEADWTVVCFPANEKADDATTSWGLSVLRKLRNLVLITDVRTYVRVTTDHDPHP